MARLFYCFILYLLSPLVFLHLWLRGKKAPEYRKRWHERLGNIKQLQLTTAPIVFHCASVGEVVAATPLIKRIQTQLPQLNILVTCNTPTGTQQIQRSFQDSVEHVYLPLDFPGAVKRFLNTLQPQLICILETELWPNLIHYSQQQRIPTLLLNARLSEKSLAGYQKIAPLSKQIMQQLTMLAAHDQQDAERFIQLGLDHSKVTTTGSIKFDISISQSTQDKVAQLKQQLKPKSSIWIAGSTHPGEEQQLLQAHKTLLQADPDALLILVPRHPEQFDKVANLITEHELTIQRKSSLSHGTCEAQVLLGDTMGELGMLYGVADCAFIGGSLIERGGHNPLEASAYGIPVLTGPHIFNFQHIYPQLITSQGCIKVNSAEQLSEQLNHLFKHPVKRAEIGQYGAKFVQQNQGAIDKTISLISRQLNL